MYSIKPIPKSPKKSQFDMIMNHYTHPIAETYVLHNRIDGDTLIVPNKQETIVTNNDKLCSRCGSVILNELKADPFFTGIFICVGCRQKPRKLKPVDEILPRSNFAMETYIDDPLPDRKYIPRNIQIDTKHVFAGFSDNDALPTPIATPPQRLGFIKADSIPSMRVSQLLFSSVESGSYQISKPDHLYRSNDSPIVPNKPSTIHTEKSIDDLIIKESRGRAYITQYELCSACDGLNTSGIVITDKGIKMCRKCFKAANLKSTTNRICNKCKKWNTSKWYTDRLAAGHICKSCYTKRRTTADFDGIEGERICTRCQMRKSPLWYQDKVSTNGYICIGCYNLQKKIKK